MSPRGATVAGGPTLEIGALHIRLLALVVEANGDESYCVAFRRTAGPFVSGVLRHTHDKDWELAGDAGSTRLSWASPDEVLALALATGVSPDVAEAAPSWPPPLMDRLSRRRLSGPGTLAFDAEWFLAELSTSALDHPILLPDGASKLGLAGLERATAILNATAKEGGLADMLERALETTSPIDSALAWTGEGRLIGEFDGGELAQLAADIPEGCRAALGRGALTVVFPPGEPLGLGLGPLRHTDETGGEAGSAGAGCMVGEVDPGGAADRAGVSPGMALSQLSSLDLPAGGLDTISFEAVLDAIDAPRAVGHPLTITFNTAAPVSHLYAVEMPAATTLAALAATVAGGPRLRSRDVGVGASLDALCGPALLWREDTPRLFLGDAGSVSAAHTDMCPQVQMAHGLLGTKLLGVASHPATPRLRAEHAPGDGELADHGPTIIPTDRPLTDRASRLLGDPKLTIAALRPGDIAVFDSGALHFASNGGHGISGALYHGMITPGAVARLRLAAAAHSGSPVAGPYAGHLYAPELLRLVQRRLGALSKGGGRS